MATLKNLLNSAMLKLGSAGAQSRGAGVVSIAFDSTTTEDQYYVPPADGFITMSGGTAQKISIAQAAIGRRIGIVSNWTSEYFPVRKGWQVVYGVYNLSEGFVINFVPSVGGGIIEFLRSLFAKEVAYVC